MRLISFKVTIIFILLLAGLAAQAQNCRKFHLYGKCMQYPGLHYKMEGQSRSNIIGVGDKLIYNVILYGERNYKLIFCASDLFYPVHFTLTDDLSKKLIYDNSKDEYSETIELSIENTRRVLVEISVLAHDADNEVKTNYFGCLGFLIYWKPEGK